MEKKFQKVNDWLTNLEEKVAIRTGRRSGRATKEMQLQQMKVKNIVKAFLKQNKVSMSIPDGIVKMRASFSIYSELLTKIMFPRELCAF